MEILKPIGSAYFDEQEQTTKIIIDENMVENLAELADYNYIVLALTPYDTPEEKKLKEIFGEKAREVKKAKLISVIGNVITVEKLTHRGMAVGKVNQDSLYLPFEIEDIKYLPEYTDSMDAEDNENMDVKAGENPKPVIWLNILPENGMRRTL